VGIDEQTWYLKSFKRPVCGIKEIKPEGVEEFSTFEREIGGRGLTCRKGLRETLGRVIRECQGAGGGGRRGTTSRRGNVGAPKISYLESWVEKGISRTFEGGTLCDGRETKLGEEVTPIGEKKKMDQKVSQ